MTTAREPFGSALLLALTATATGWVSMIAWRGITELDGAYLGPLLVIGIGIAVSGVLVRRLAVPPLLAVLLQVLVAAWLMFWTVSGSLIPTGDAIDAFARAFSQAGDSARQYAPPVPDDVPGIHPLLILGGTAAMLSVDLLACTARKVSLIGLPLLLVYSIPVSVVPGGVSAWVFALTAVFFLLLLYLSEVAEVRSWGRPARTGDTAGFGVQTGAGRSPAVGIAAGAIALGILAPLVIPTLSLSVFGFGNRRGTGDDITVSNPMIDLKRDLERGEDVPLLRLESPEKGAATPSYLRISVLTQYENEAWRPGDRYTPPAQRAEGQELPQPGLANTVATDSSEYQVQTLDSFDSTYLPTLYPAASVSARGDWRFDDTTMDFISYDEDLDTRGIEYSMEALDRELTPKLLESASSSTQKVDAKYLDVPTLPPSVQDLTSQVTRNYTSRYEKAVALQEWFRTEFRYSLAKSSEGNSPNELEAFLNEDGGRVGYCEQFAASMALMARQLGIPSRVAVGFLEPDAVSPGVWEYSSHDMHAWPELYFENAGWVRFEPTPGTRAPEPAYTDGSSLTETPETPEGPSEQATPSQRPSEDPRRDTADRPETPEQTAPEQQEPDSFPWAPVLAGVAVVLVLIGLCLVPGLVRRRRREARLRGTAEEVWTELHDTAVDLRLGWPQGRSPRQVRDWLGELFGDPDDPVKEFHDPRSNPRARRALADIAAVLERNRYSRTEQSTAGTLAEEGRLCIEAMQAGALLRHRRRAKWLPASLWAQAGAPRSVPSVEEERPSELTSTGSGVAEHLD